MLPAGFFRVINRAQEASADGVNSAQKKKNRTSENFPKDAAFCSQNFNFQVKKHISPTTSYRLLPVLEKKKQKKRKNYLFTLHHQRPLVSINPNALEERAKTEHTAICAPME